MVHQAVSGFTDFKSLVVGSKKTRAVLQREMSFGSVISFLTYSFSRGRRLRMYER